MNSARFLRTSFLRNTSENLNPNKAGFWGVFFQIDERLSKENKDLIQKVHMNLCHLLATDIIQLVSFCVIPV